MAAAAAMSMVLLLALSAAASAALISHAAAGADPSDLVAGDHEFLDGPPSIQAPILDGSASATTVRRTNNDRRSLQTEEENDSDSDCPVEILIGCTTVDDNIDCRDAQGMAEHDEGEGGEDGGGRNSSGVVIDNPELCEVDVRYAFTVVNSRFHNPDELPVTINELTTTKGTFNADLTPSVELQLGGGKVLNAGEKVTVLGATQTLNLCDGNDADAIIIMASVTVSVPVLGEEDGGGGGAGAGEGGGGEGSTVKRRECTIDATYGLSTSGAAADGEPASSSSPDPPSLPQAAGPDAEAEAKQGAGAGAGNNETTTAGPTLADSTAPTTATTAVPTASAAPSTLVPTIDAVPSTSGPTTIPAPSPNSTLAPTSTPTTSPSPSVSHFSSHSPTESTMPTSAVLSTAVAYYSQNLDVTANRELTDGELAIFENVMAGYTGRYGRSGAALTEEANEIGPFRLTDGRVSTECVVTDQFNFSGHILDEHPIDSNGTVNGEGGSSGAELNGTASGDGSGGGGNGTSSNGTMEGGPDGAAGGVADGGGGGGGNGTSSRDRARATRERRSLSRSLAHGGAVVQLGYTVTWSSLHTTVTTYPAQFRQFVNANLDQVATDLQEAGLTVVIVVEEVIRARPPTPPTPAPVLGTSAPSAAPSSAPTMQERRPSSAPSRIAVPEQRGLSTGGIVGIVLGVVAFAVAVGYFANWKRRDRERRVRERTERKHHRKDDAGVAGAGAGAAALTAKEEATKLEEGAARGIENAAEEKKKHQTRDTAATVEMSDRSSPPPKAATERPHRTTAAAAADGGGAARKASSDGAMRMSSDVFSTYRDKNLEKMRTRVQSHVGGAGTEDMMNQAVTTALLMSVSSGGSGGGGGVGDSARTLSVAEEQTSVMWCEQGRGTAEVEAGVLCETNDWVKKHRAGGVGPGGGVGGGSSGGGKDAFLQRTLNEMVVCVRRGYLEADDASRIIHECAAMLGLPLAQKLPRTTVIVTNMRMGAGREDVLRAFERFGNVDEAAVAPNERGFGIVRFHSAKAVLRVMERFETGEVVVQDVAVTVRVLKSEF